MILFKNFINKILFFFLIFLFFSLPLINSHLLDILGIKIGFYVNGNYEFTKVIFFNIFSGIILLLYGIKLLLKKEKIILPKHLFFIILFLIISTFFSISFYTSLFGGTEKGHGVIMFLNLIGIFLILINLKEKKKNILLKTSIYSGVIVGLLGIKELYDPSFNYGELSNRLVSTFGHPNYVSLYLILLIPLILNIKYKIKKNINILILFFLIITLVLTKSFIAIFIVFTYLFFIFLNKFKLKYFLYIFLVFLSIFSIIKFAPEKISSLVSRFFIWETTIKIILSDLKIFLFGGGLETLIYFFDNFKSPYLYIFEKIGFSADRPHNIILNFFYNFGIFGLFFILYIYKKIFQNFYKQKSSINASLFFGALFLLFNYSSIASYLLLTLIFSLNYNKKFINNSLIKDGLSFNIKYYFYTIILGLFSISSIYISSLFYTSEIQVYKNNYKTAINIFPYNAYNYYKIGDYNSGLKIEKNKSEEYYLTKIYFLKYPEQNCKQLINIYNSIENYFFCGNLLWEIGKYDTAKKLYNSGLKKLPDLWNKNSLYYKNIFIKNFINGNRFFSEKYSNINEILERIKK